MTDSPRDVVAHNWETFLEHGPGLNAGYQTYIVARDPAKRRVLLGGLGGCGVGQMWFDEQEDHRGRIGYAEAPIVSAPDDAFGADLASHNVANEISAMSKR